MEAKGNPAQTVLTASGAGDLSSQHGIIHRKVLRQVRVQT